MASLLSRREELRALRLARSQPESAGEFQELIEEITERTVQMVLGDERVRARLEGVRHAVVAADYREDKPTGEHEETFRRAEVGIYDYDHDVMVVVVVDLREGTVIEYLDRRGVQPPITAEEIEAARSLASRDQHWATLLSRSDMNIVAFPTPSYLEAHARAGHRCATLYLASERTHHEVVEITVDLSAQQVVPQEELLEGSPRLSRGSQPDR
jgi:hypothetical protein